MSIGPVVVSTRGTLDAALAPARAQGLTVALVPTMGALHDGHLALVARARDLADVVVVSIFVNPTQFGAGEDLDRYPRTFDADLEKLSRAGADVVYHPEVTEMYPEGPGAVGVNVDPGPLGSELEGAVRPTHFRGVLTVVAKLFGLARPDFAVFGEKDYQQLVLIRQMVRTLCLPVVVVGCATVREDDGLALSSRNRYLDNAQRELAVSLSRALRAGADAGPSGAVAVLDAAQKAFGEADGVDVDYLTLRAADLTDPLPGQEARLLVAARLGSTRLIDNVAVSLGADKDT
ncbi:pantoate--beta-alanine ligase [Mumia zhuanghuii]|uniref:Pantothenate synthetase n=2 Tax=Mumia TaxID=1546255 RepID=A0A5Q6RJ08_9ACTN|nr:MULTISPECIES: pantoate--beta-alanine ligase [Mumia]KAA1418066.1 pantoate--beta-alanine ligase [Mumia zhuanghuii]KAA1424379.1 pantoate--beta-alanine ligase [Mumia zhuanghuii]